MIKQSLSSVSSQVSILNERIKDELSKPEITLIGDLALSKDDVDQLFAGLQSLFTRHFGMYSESYAESLVFTLVHIAQNYYDNIFWDLANRHLINFNPEQRRKIYRIFRETCIKYDMPVFDQQSKDGYTIITPIICHAGIPTQHLDSFFQPFEERISHTDDIIIENIDSIFSQSHISVRRFLSTLGDDFITFMNQWLVISESGDSNSISLDLEENLHATFPTEEILIPTRFIVKYVEWLNRPIEMYGGRTIKRTRFKRPYVHMNPSGIGLTLNLPQQQIDPQYHMSTSEKLYWIITIDDNTSIVPTYLYFNSNLKKWLSEDASFILKENMFSDLRNQTISVEAILDDSSEPIWKTSIPLLEKGYFRFNSAGVLQQPENQLSYMMLMLPKHLDVNLPSKLDDLPSIPYWPSFKTYEVQLKGSEILCIINRSNSKEIDRLFFYGSQEINIDGGLQLFSNSNIFSQLPTVVIPASSSQSVALVITNVWERGTENNIELDGRAKSVDLNSIIATNEYGKYELKYVVENRTKSRETIYYVPEITLKTDRSFWPEPLTGYSSNSYTFEMPNFIDLQLDQHIVGSDNLGRSLRRKTLTTHTSLTKVRGIIQLEVGGSEHAIPFTMPAHPLLWSLISLNEDDHQPVDTTIREEWNRLKRISEPNLVIEIGDLGSDSLTGYVKAIRADKKLFYTRKMRLISSKPFVLPIADILLTAEREQTKRFQILLGVIDPYGSLVNEFPILISQDAIDIMEPSVVLNKYDISFSWEEKGSKADRALVVQNILTPWEKHSVYPLMDSSTTHQLPASLFADGIYTVKIESPPNDSPFTNIYFKPKSLFQTTFEPIDNSYGSYADPVTELNRMAYVNLSNGNSNKFALPKHLTLDNSTDIIRFSKSYLSLLETIVELSKKQKDNKYDFQCIKEEYQALAQSTKLSPKQILNALFDDSFLDKHMIELINVFDIAWLTDEDCREFSNPVAFQTLTRVMPELAFQIAVSTGRHLDWLVKWIGEQDLGSLLGVDRETDLVDTLALGIDGELRSTQNVAHKNYWPSYQEYIDFFMFLYQKQTYKHTPHQNLFEESLNEYENMHYAHSKRLFGLTSLNQWSEVQLAYEANRGCEEFESLSETMSKYIYSYLRPHINQISETFLVITNLIDDIDGSEQVPEILYSIYTIMFFALVCRHDKHKELDHELLRKIADIRRFFPQIYRYTLVLIEMKLLYGEIR